MCITLCSGVQMLVDGLFTSVGMFTRLYIDKPLIQGSTGPPIWPHGGSVACDKHDQRDEHDHHDQPGQKGWFQTVLYVDVTMANGNELLLKCENVDTTKDTWSCRCCHHFGSVVTYLKQFMRPEISHQVGEAHEILVIGEANASHFLFSYTAM